MFIRLTLERRPRIADSGVPRKRRGWAAMGRAGCTELPGFQPSRPLTFCLHGRPPGWLASVFSNKALVRRKTAEK